MPLCPKQCPIEAYMPSLQVVFILVMNSPGYLRSGSITAGMNNMKVKCRECHKRLDDTEAFFGHIGYIWMDRH
jgi:hypothetical protein